MNPTENVAMALFKHLGKMFERDFSRVSCLTNEFDTEEDAAAFDEILLTHKIGGCK